MDQEVLDNLYKLSPPSRQAFIHNPMQNDLFSPSEKQALD